MNILFSSDDNYARHMGVAIYSILLHNMDVDTIRIFVIDNRISQQNIEKLKSEVQEFKNADIRFFPFDKYENQLHLNLAWPISLSSYARLFIGEVLPEEIGRVIYMDCDIVVDGSLKELWDEDLEGNCLGAIQDVVPSKTKTAVGLLPDQSYFNAGVLLIDMNRWRNRYIGKKCLNFLNSHEGRISHHDQGVLNGILCGQWKRLPLKYNVMTIHFILSQNKIKRLFKDEAVFYDVLEIEDAVNNPCILHFTPSLTNRPWEKNCCHPLRYKYCQLLLNTPWEKTPLVKSNTPWYVYLFNLRFRFLPI